MLNTKQTLENMEKLDLVFGRVLDFGATLQPYNIVIEFKSEIE